jgi:uncharacterized protein YlaI
MKKECKHKYIGDGRTTLFFYGARLPKHLQKVRDKVSKQNKKKRNPLMMYRCKKCGDRMERPMTTEEKRKYGALDRASWREGNRLHKVWYKFQKEFFDWDKYQWKYGGYEFMQRVRAYANRNKSIVITRCDDDAHAGAMLVLIPHRNATRYMGTTVLFVNQFNDAQPVQFFLYPEHETALRKGLTEAKKKTWK